MAYISCFVKKYGKLCCFIKNLLVGKTADLKSLILFTTVM